ncbi:MULTISPECIES: AraC family transcriptional regulator [Phaeobacter]|uniref:Transcriptional regulator, AraC family n=1 Tax=Phaeobacter piscinae TaxID=1580596 RepID=A0ABN5DF84_9RHOB|nr:MULTISPECIES: AraC family transcriptional regulator [Phaeobacter]ATG36071.1 transcriptional regulator, AraC family [Phaeobacter piscinae]AUQ86592.1 transcriptional regulator, AraC family [Phaeobacter piscinae]AUR24475.1 transcriptional regulator, AraC family [Phaeobacter piscinae]KII14722.1 AraC family transcriptional regulator [Phaeobacter sp. S60]
MTPGLERSCAQDWVCTAPWQAGVQRIEAYFSGDAYAPHRHDTYSIGYTIRGVQRFDYRGARSDSLPGQVIVLHPDEIHTGEAGTEAGFHYRMLYVEPSLIRQALGVAGAALPFLREAVLTDPVLVRAIHSAFSDMENVLEPVALDEISALLADGLVANDPSAQRASAPLTDFEAAQCAREFMDANACRIISSDELETVTGQGRFALSRHFRKAFGTSPYRYQTMRRLDRAKAEIASGGTLADVAITTGFSDQAHMTRQFKANFGISPGEWSKLTRRARLLPTS